MKVRNFDNVGKTFKKFIGKIKDQLQIMFSFE